MSKPFMLQPHRFGRVWARHELRRLRELRAAGKDFPEIGKILDRPASSCRTKCVQLGVRSPVQRRGGDRKQFTALRTVGRGPRPCMRCTHPFMSDGPHNRLCKSCRRIDISPFDVPVTVLR